MTYQFTFITELYGHGQWLRKWLGWPEWLPFPAYSEHGVSFDSYHAPHELNNEFLIHFFWSDHKKKYAFQVEPFKKKIFIQVPHPYLTLKLHKFRFCDSSRSGLLVFWPHMSPGYSYSVDYIEKYLDYLRTLRSKFNKITICISYYELGESWCSKIIDEFDTVSAGNTNHPLFSENLFKIIDSYEYATSPSEGSAMSYCTMMGVKYFIGGPIPIYQNDGDINIPKGTGLNRSMSFNSQSERVRDLFSEERLEVWSDKVEFMEQVLGVSANPNRAALRIYLCLELIRLLLLTNHGRWAISYYKNKVSKSMANRRFYKPLKVIHAGIKQLRYKLKGTSKKPNRA